MKAKAGTSQWKGGQCKGHPARIPTQRRPQQGAGNGITNPVESWQDEHHVHGHPQAVEAAVSRCEVSIHAG